ncbi:hypothetical protein VOLCADRAFT_94765 [Volvox carteri f. nagariensis]|uniref:Peptidase M16 N-terminal domain-containing protein n=1 Tax=Volvox carteri f. nagariensis TaxID=3068 RepID=D8U5P3_VOLCA|nr:uncharacterized protein VOLCADRAFT_94765 [Volvox carteri f. nagariensis]EFJ44956.1 hypothetical protein VOLCADRAFT_94765 [Volvox carteri f. nagariensis]|eukprot:XP_002953927.1 hypothetical protein VOLCADRAFT_94765 [Volvox carteri f. nagariensis]
MIRRSYEVLTVGGDGEAPGARFLLVSDPEAVFAAVCLNMQAGYFDDPPDVPGFAHWLEHAVHLGSVRYPDDKDYKYYLSQHGGTSNASTGMVHTCYHFTVASAHLRGALDRMARFFIDPLLRRDSILREAENIHAEFSRNCNSDARKLLQLRRSAAGGLLAKFSTGNAATLLQLPAAAGLDVPAALAAFWRRRYQAGALCGCVVGPQPLSELSVLVREAFGDLRLRAGEGEEGGQGQGQGQGQGPGCGFGGSGSGGVVRPHGQQGPQQQLQDEAAAGLAEPEPVPVGAPETADVGGAEETAAAAAAAAAAVQIGRKEEGGVSAAEIRQLRQLEVVWYLPYGMMEDIRSKPWRWAGHVLGHEGRGSLAALLRGAGLAQELTTGPFDEVRLGRGFLFWGVTVTLSEAGLRRAEDVVRLVFAAVRAMRSLGEEQRRSVWGEVAAAAAVRWQYQDRTAPLDLARDVAQRLHYFEPEAVLSGNALLYEYDGAALERFLSYITPQNCNVFLSDSFLSDRTDRVEPWYGARYSVEPLNFELYDSDAAACVAGGGAAAACSSPASASASAAHDDDIVGETHVYVHLITRAVYETPDAWVTARLACRLLEELLQPDVYDAQLVGTSYSLSASETGLHLSFHGFSDVVVKLVEMVAAAMAGVTLAQVEGRPVRDTCWPATRILLLAPEAAEPASPGPEQQRKRQEKEGEGITEPASSSANTSPTSNSTAVAAAAALPPPPPPVDLQEAGKAVQSDRGDGGLHGGGAGRGAATAGPTDSGSGSGVRGGGGVCGPVLWRYVPANPNPSNTNSAVFFLCQVGEDDPLDVRPAVLLDLFTKVASKPAFHELRTRQRLGYVVSLTKHRLGGGMGLALVPERLASFKASLEEKYLEPPRSLAEAAGNCWRPIRYRSYDFCKGQRKAEALRSLGLQDLVCFFDQHVCPTSPSARVLCCEIGGGQRPAARARRPARGTAAGERGDDGATARPAGAASPAAGAGQTAGRAEDDGAEDADAAEGGGEGAAAAAGCGGWRRVGIEDLADLHRRMPYFCHSETLGVTRPCLDRLMVAREAVVGVRGDAAAAATAAATCCASGGRGGHADEARALEPTSTST